jgi:hypothetical protein
MTTSEDAQAPTTVIPKKRFIGKARAETLRKKASEQQSGPNIEDGVIATRGTCPNFRTLLIPLGAAPRGGRVANQIPADILEDPALNEAIKIVLSSL